MKKILLALLVLTMAVVIASGQNLSGISIEWSTLWAGYTHQATDLQDGEEFYLLDYYTVTWQLIYAGANNAIDPIDLSNGANGWVSGDDVVWATRILLQSVGGANVVDSNGTEWYNYLGYVEGNIIYNDTSWTTAGYFYQRVYQGAPDVGSWYFQTELEPLQINPAMTQTHFLDSPGGPGFQPNQQIPEPATMGLLGLGALALAFRRRRA